MRGVDEVVVKDKVLELLLLGLGLGLDLDVGVRKVGGTLRGLWDEG